MKDFVINSDLINEWNWEKNTELGFYPDKMTLGSGRNVWWLCGSGHEWQAKISNRANGNCCPYCADYYILLGYNDLTTTRPDLVEEWCYEKNKDILPTQISRGYNKKVWWKCNKCGHEWQASPNSRDNMGSGCPECAKGNRVSSQEMKLYYYIKKYFPNAISGYTNKELTISEIDIYIPELRIGIEYDGTKWHTDTNHDKKKDDACYQHNIKLIRVREPKCPVYESNCIFMNLANRSKHTLENVCTNMLNMLGVKDPDVDFDRDLIAINNLIVHKQTSNSLAILYPDVAKEWHPVKNGNFTPYDVSPKSDKRAWWLCSDCYNEWVSMVKDRTKGSGCPNCARSVVRKAHCKSVYCPELEQNFESMADAEKQTGVNNKNISACIRGIRKSAGRHPTTGEKLTWRL